MEYFAAARVSNYDGGKLNSDELEPQPAGEPAQDDFTLVTEVLQKNRKATAEFVNRYTDAVYSYIRRRLAPRYDLVDDLVHDVFIAAWENLSAYRAVSPLRAWLLGIARHKIEDYYRVLLQSSRLLESGEAEELAAADFDLEAIADRDRTERRAIEVLCELPEHYRIALRWRYWEKRNAREMAAATGRSEKAVERLLARAREQFRRRWVE